MEYKIITPKKFNKKEKKLFIYISKYSPVKIFGGITGEKWTEQIIINHRNLGEAAQFKNHNIYLDFNQPIDYIWICICHELAHMILREKIKWNKSKEARKAFRVLADFHTPKMKNNFRYAFEQTMAIFLQAACEERIRRRPLEWSEWQKTFEAMDVEKLGKIIWESFCEFLSDKNRGKKYRIWLKKTLIYAVRTLT